MGERLRECKQTLEQQFPLFERASVFSMKKPTAFFVSYDSWRSCDSALRLSAQTGTVAQLEDSVLKTSCTFFEMARVDRNADGRVYG